MKNSVRRMAERLGLSVNTVHRAYKLLAIDGRIQLVHGKGCFWGSAPSFDVKPEESVYSVVERLFQNDLDSGVLNAFDELPSCKELSNRYAVSPYIVKKFLLQKRFWYGEKNRPVTFLNRSSRRSLPQGPYQ